MKVKLHAATIEHVRALLAAERGALPVDAPDVTVRGAAVIAHDVMTSIEGMLKALATPVCGACAAKQNGEGA